MEVEGEMHADTAFDSVLRNRFLANNRLHGKANVLIMPNLDAANIAYNLVKMTAADGFSVGPYTNRCCTASNMYYHQLLVCVASSICQQLQ